MFAIKYRRTDRFIILKRPAFNKLHDIFFVSPVKSFLTDCKLFDNPRLPKLIVFSKELFLWQFYLITKFLSMKKVYYLSGIMIMLLFGGCSKDIFRSFENRIIGTWKITNVNRLGIGGNPENLPFRDGIFTFNSNGTLSYNNGSGSVFKGNWEITRLQGDDNSRRVLKVTAIDFANQSVLSEYYDDMNFRGTDFFVARIDRPLVRLTTHFRR